ncbi:uncharacterized protein LOC128224469 [Mya arenaria]|nr:uncharacterized protein LOC128224469 [Mya arenaria]
MTVSSCNQADHCSEAVSDSILIDHSPPITGGFRQPMTWSGFKASNDTFITNLALSFYGFSDQESGVKAYYLTAGLNYSSSELLSLIHRKKATANDDFETTNATVTLKAKLKNGDKIILSAWAENHAGLNSSIARVTVVAMENSNTLEGVLEVEKHSCDVHYCNNDCTCAVVGKPCTKTEHSVECSKLDVSIATNRGYPIVHVIAGLSKTHQDISPSSSCLAASWDVSFSRLLYKIHRFEWSMGLYNYSFGEGIFDNDVMPWKDVGKNKQVIHCLERDRRLQHGAKYVIYVRAWYSSFEYSDFSSPIVTIDHTPPKVKRGKFIKDADTTCYKDFDVIDWNDTITGCWENVFQETQGHITHYTVSLGTTINGSDIVPYTNVQLSTQYTFDDLRLTHGTRVFITVTAYNNAGLHVTISSDGFIVDIDNPTAGVIFNTEHHQDSKFQNPGKGIRSSWHGFVDTSAGIKTYAAVMIDTQVTDYDNLTFKYTGLQTQIQFKDVNIKQGNTYKVLVKAFDSAGHMSRIAESSEFVVDTTPPAGFVCGSYQTVVDRNSIKMEKEIAFSIQQPIGNVY